jgi:hypothetical protein
MTTAGPRGFAAGGRPTVMFAPERGARTPAVISVAFLLTALFLTPLVLRPQDTQTYYLALVLTVLTTLPLVTRIASGTLDVFEPIIPISILIGLAFGVRTMYIAYAPVTLMPLRMGALRADEFTDSALLLTIAAYCALLAGYYVMAGPLRLAPFSAGQWGRRWATSTLKGPAIAALLGIAVVATGISRPVGFEQVTSTTTPVAMLAGLAQLSGCILALHIAAGDPRRWLRLTLWFVAVPLAAWQSLVFGAKAPILMMIFAIMAAGHYARRRIPLRFLIAGVILAVAIVFPIVNAFRAAPRRIAEPTASSTLSGFASQVIAIPTRFSGMTTSEYVQYATDGVMSRSTGVDALSLLLKYDVSAELGNAAAYLPIPAYAFIPRAIWSSKPVLNQGVWFGRLLVVPSSEGINSIASFGIFHIGDLLVSFGIAGVMIGMCVLGFLYRLIYRFIDPLNSPDLGVKFVYIFLLWNMVNGFEGDIPSAYASLLRSLVVLWIPVKIWFNAPLPDNTMFQPRVIHAGAARSNLAR